MPSQAAIAGAGIVGGEAGHRAVDQAAGCARAWPPQPSPSRSITPGPEVLDQDVGAVDQALGDVQVVGLLQIEA